MQRTFFSETQNVNKEMQDMSRELNEKINKNNDEDDPVVLSARKDFYETILTEAINDLTPEMLKKLGIDIIHGTMMKISILQIAALWKKHRGKMLEVLETLEKIIKEIAEDMQNGLLVKITPDAFICFFPDKPKQHSILRGLCTAMVLHMHLLKNPIYLEDTLVKIQVCISYGPVYKRALHIQRKTLYDYYGEIVDDLLYKVDQTTIPLNGCTVGVCNNNPLIKKYIAQLDGKIDNVGVKKVQTDHVSKNVTCCNVPKSLLLLQDTQACPEHSKSPQPC